MTYAGGIYVGSGLSLSFNLSTMGSHRKHVSRRVQDLIYDLKAHSGCCLESGFKKTRSKRRKIILESSAKVHWCQEGW